MLDFSSWVGKLQHPKLCGLDGLVRIISKMFLYEMLQLLLQAVAPGGGSGPLLSDPARKMLAGRLAYGSTLGLTRSLETLTFFNSPFPLLNMW